MIMDMTLLAYQLGQFINDHDLISILLASK